MHHEPSQTIHSPAISPGQAHWERMGIDEWLGVQQARRSAGKTGPKVTNVPGLIMVDHGLSWFIQFVSI